MKFGLSGLVTIGSIFGLAHGFANGGRMRSDLYDCPLVVQIQCPENKYDGWFINPDAIMGVPERQRFSIFQGFITPQRPGVPITVDSRGSLETDCSTVDETYWLLQCDVCHVDDDDDEDDEENKWKCKDLFGTLSIPADNPSAKFGWSAASGQRIFGLYGRELLAHGYNDWYICERGSEVSLYMSPGGIDRTVERKSQCWPAHLIADEF
ncbi:hypothetical protein TRVA0_048S00804 [Trichomonascus vanleenenianus]|uniref:uncharacterized protein n=1 Tax=Trichomonascus vanleenenianus TaxID=2268995 RepID=UPI003ECA658D